MTFYPNNSYQLSIFNSETRKLQPFTKTGSGPVKIYTCGPTVYNFAHIGNFRTYVFEDLLRRTIQFFGMKVDQVMNLTDVDDKTIQGAIHQKTTLEAYTKPYIEAFFEDIKTLNIQPAEHYPAATEYIEVMIKIIEDLLKKGIAYKGSDDCIYYAISKFSPYGRLSHLKLDELQVDASERCFHDEYDKENASDFVLWKAYDETRDGMIFWESPFGKGRPGWHLECSAMAMEILGSTVDIHLGGVDNMFPHHENEIAQSEAYSGCTFSRYWMHVEHLIVDGKKMSKSANNFYTLRDLLDKGYSGLEVRYLLMQTHYKTQLNFTLAGLEAARHSLFRLQDMILRLESIQQAGKTGCAEEALQKAFSGFATSLADDLNISSALAALFEMVREINVLCDAEKIGREDAREVLELLRQFNTVLGVLTFGAKEQIPADLQEMFDRRNQARKEKNWALADTLRDQITALGYLMEDTPTGIRLKKRV